MQSGNKCFGSDHGILRALLNLPQAATALPLEPPDDDSKAPPLQGAVHAGEVESQAATSFAAESIGTLPHGEQEGEGDVKRQKLE